MEDDTMMPVISNQKPLLYKDVVLTPPREPIAVLDGLPMMDRSLVSYKKYFRYLSQCNVKNCISLLATRGCPFKCAYCHKIWPKKQLSRSCENVFAEVRMYYDMGIRRFSFVDDTFNFNRKNSSGVFKLIIQNKLDVQLFFNSGLRGDIMTPDYIDLMVEAGTVSLSFALETASPRLQKLINKNLQLDNFRVNLEYILDKYPHIITELFTMHGFPTETEKEAGMTLDFIKSLKGLHFAYINILKIYPNTEMEKLALENGISRDKIGKSLGLAYHELPETLPFEKHFTKQYQADYLNNYFLKKERLLSALSYQMKLLTEDEIIRKYNAYLGVTCTGFNGLLRFLGLSKDELNTGRCLAEETFAVPGLDDRLKEFFPAPAPCGDPLKVLLLDLSQFFSSARDRLYNRVEQPLGLMALLSYLNVEFGGKVRGKIAKSFIDFDSYEELKMLLYEFKPDIIGIRTLTYYKDFFHEAVHNIRHWGINVPVIAGGPYASSSYISHLQDPNIDLVVLGEGEITFSEIIAKMIENNKELPGEEILRDIPGIAFLKDRQLIPAQKTLSQKEEFRF